MKKEDRIKKALEANWVVPPLPEGHEDRFIRKLERGTAGVKQRRIWPSVVTLVAAASLLLILSLWRGTNSGGAVDTLSMVKGYYAALIWEESEYIAGITEQMNHEERENLLSEVKYIKEEADSIADTILEGIDNEDEKIHYMIVVYSSHLNSLKKLSAYLQPNYRSEN